TIARISMTLVSSSTGGETIGAGRASEDSRVTPAKVMTAVPMAGPRRCHSSWGTGGIWAYALRTRAHYRGLWRTTKTGRGLRGCAPRESHEELFEVGGNAVVVVRRGRVVGRCEDVVVRGSDR